jgi:AraC-like DNA-binding protein
MSEERLSNRYLRVLVDAVEHRGVSRARFLAAAGWDAEQLDAVEGRVACAEYYRVCELAIDLTGDPALGLHTAEVMRPDSVDLVGQLAAHAPDVRKAIEAQLRFHKLAGDRPCHQLIEGDGRVTLRFACPGGLSARAQRFAAELHTVGMARLFRYFARKARPLEVCFEHAAPAYRAEYERIFCGAERFEQPFTGIVFERTLMNAARRYRDDEFHRTLCTLADSRVSRLERPGSCIERLRAVIARHGARSRLGMDAVAREIGVSTRSLRRRLASEGTSFDAVVNDTLARRAIRLLSVERMTIQETAYALGYSDTTAFHRAFKRWTGKTPSTWQAEETPA